MWGQSWGHALLGCSGMSVLMVCRAHLSCQHSTPGVPAPVAMTHRLQGQRSGLDPSTSGGSGSQKSVHGTGETGFGNTARACLWNVPPNLTAHIKTGQNTSAEVFLNLMMLKTCLTPSVKKLFY